jgi:hypothetical protein
MQLFRNWNIPLLFRMYYYWYRAVRFWLALMWSSGSWFCVCVCVCARALCCWSFRGTSCICHQGDNVVACRGRLPPQIHGKVRWASAMSQGSRIVKSSLFRAAAWIWFYPVVIFPFWPCTALHDFLYWELSSAGSFGTVVIRKVSLEALYHVMLAPRKGEEVL